MDATLDKVVRSPRLAARRRAVRLQRRRRRRRIGVGLLLVALSTAGGIAVSRSLLFDLARIDVVGARSVDHRDVLRASGLEVGQSVLGVDMGRVADRIRRLPGVRDARIERDGSLALRIIVIERRPAVQIWSGDRRWNLDEDGQQVPAGMWPEGRIPVIRIARAPGVGSVLPKGTSAGVLQIWGALPEQLRAAAGPFEPLADGGFSFSVGKTSILFGEPDRIAEKVEAIALVRQRVAEERGRLVRLDVRSPERPAAKIL